MYKINVHCISDLISAITILLFVLLIIIIAIIVKYQCTDWFVPMNYMYDVKCKHDQAQASLKRCDDKKLQGDFDTLHFFHLVIVQNKWMSVFCGLYYYRPDDKNYNFLNCDWFKKLLFPTNSSCYRTACYRTVCYRTVQQIKFKINQSHSKSQFKSTNHNLSFNNHRNSVQTPKFMHPLSVF